MSDRSWLTAPIESGRKAGFGLYLHVPFCAHRCGYCDFATYDDRAHLMDRYVRALRIEVERWAARRAWPQVTSVFVGGGTPTVLAAGDLAGLIATAGDAFPVAPDAEVTVEANPETVTADLATALAEVGVTRLSVGAQSFAPQVLETLERRHDPERVPVAVAAARSAGIAEVNVDLIYGTPGEADGDWLASVERVLETGVDHVSAYALTVAPNTPLERRVSTGELAAPDPDVQRARYDLACEALSGAGFEQYEISSWARAPSRRSKHNVLYWRHGDYLGIGVGAHGHLDGHRFWSHRSIERWLEHVEDGLPPIASEERLDDDERARERLLLGLRLREGLHPHDVPVLDPVRVQHAADLGLLELSCGRFQASERGWFLLDDLLLRLF